MAVGIICEYNPFHNGHIYHLEKVKGIAKDEEIILILGGNFTQRGGISIIEKFDKTKLALQYGIDLVIELPFEFSTQSSDIFAKGAVTLLHLLKCEKIVFGSESNNIDLYKELANIQLNDNRYNKIVKQELEKGLNYPTAMSKALSELAGKTITESNDILALSYVKEIIKNHYNIEPISIKRTNSYNDEELNGTINSARSIRKAIEKDKEISNSVPKETLEVINKIDETFLLNLLKYKIITNNELSKYLTVDEGLDNKLKKEIYNVKNIDELIESIKSKRYTYNKISRMLTHILCSYTKEENQKHQDIKYIRILGFTTKGQNYLNKIKKNTTVPIISNITKENINLLNLELRVDSIYNLITKRNDNLFEKKPIIINSSKM